MIGLPDKVHEAMAENAVRFRAELLRAWEPIIEPPVCDWIESHLRFGGGDRGVQLESRVGPFTFSDSPWWRFPLECAAHRRCSSIATRAATQIHKTANLLIALPLYFAEFRPGPGMIVVPDELEAKKIRDRIYAVAQESARFTDFRRIKVPPEHRWNLQEIDLGSMLIHLAWAGSRQRTRGKPCYYVWFTEVDVYRDSDTKAGDPVEAGKQRTKDVFRYKHIFESSPSEAPSTITDEESLADDRWRWFITCPYCGAQQEARFFPYQKGQHAGRGGIDFTARVIGGDGASLLAPRQAREHAHYICINGCKITSDRKQQVMEGGNWYPLGWKLGDAEPVRDPAKSVGFHMWAIHSANETFGTIAEDYLRHLKKGLKVDFYGNRLAIAYESESRIPTWVELGKRAAWTNARRTVPDRVWFLTAGIDKQGENNGARYIIRGWGPGRTSWLVDWGWIPRNESDTGPILSDLLELERRVLVADFPVVNRDNEPSVNPLGRQRIGSRLSNIDTNHLPMQIHRWEKQLSEEWLDRMSGDRLIPGRIRNIRGDHTVRPDVRFRHNLVESNARSGEKYEGGLHQWGICVYPYYSELTDLISGEPGQLGSWYVTADCLSQGREYLEQVTNFQYAITIDPRKGKKGKWGPRNGRVPVDFWDCEVYAMAAAEMVVGNMGWEESAWEQWRRTTAQRRQESEARGARRERRAADKNEEIGAR
jgi:phage terminase large subunit GpA-like protein